MLYPNDAITIPFNVDANATVTLLDATTSPRTILNIHITNFANSLEKASEINCGFTRIGAGYYNVPVDDRQMLLPCSEEITVANGDTDNPSIGQLVYINRAPETSSTIATTTQMFAAGFSWGEILNVTVLLTLCLVVCYGFLHFWLRGIKIKR